MKKELTRLFSVLLAAVLVFGTLPVSAMGTDVADPPASAVDESVVDESSAAPEEQSAEEEAVATYASNDFYKIVHLDCGRKYFSKDWIIALLYEMKNDGYNQLQLAFGNDGLRFLLNDMSFEANGTTYSHADVVSAVEAGNYAQNSSGDERWLRQDEMDEIIAKANDLGIEIVPLLNLPGHANAILDIVNDKYNAYGSNNTLDVANSAEAREFGKAIFKKYVKYFADKKCKFFNFGADEYANDASGTFSFSRLNSSQYETFISFINDLAGDIISAGMTPRAFNDGLYYNNQKIDTSKYSNIAKIQCCYWSSGWGSYPVASASTISGYQHEMINTNGDFYYVLGKDDKFDSDYSYAKNFTNTGFMGSTISNPVGSMFCIWCDYPDKETETEVAKKTRLVLRAMAQRMDNQNLDVNEDVVENGFNADGTLNKTADDSKIKISIGDSTEAADSGKIAPGETMTLTASREVLWDADNYDVVSLAPVVEDGTNAITAKKVEVTAKQVGTATITATDGDLTAEFTLKVREAGTEDVVVSVNGTSSVTVDGNVAGDYTTDHPEIATVKTELVETPGTVTYTAIDSFAAGTYIISTESDASKVNESNSAEIKFESYGGVQGYYHMSIDGEYKYLYSSGYGYNRSYVRL